MGKLIYSRGTTYTITHNYTGPYLGVTLYFTVKNVQNDSDITDVTNSILTPKNIAMAGATFPQTTTILIAATDIADTVPPGTYYYDIKVVDTNNDTFLADSGQFILKATPTNRV